jgi:uracil-DNA glycosylase
VALQNAMNGPVLVRSFAEWRSAARRLLAQQVPPHEVQWRTPHQEQDLFHDASDAAESNASVASVANTTAFDGATSDIRLPRELVTKLESASCFRSDDRWSFLYKVVWRWMLGERDVMSPADEDGRRLQDMLKAVRREEHDMHAYVRFRERKDDAGPHFVAWYEPAHDVLPQVGRHFAARMGKLSWMIATPDATAAWDGEKLHLTGPVMSGPQAIDDHGESLWLTYYRSIFNPSRLNEKLMQSHIPSRFWKNLPEGQIVPSMVASAANGERRVGQARAVGERSGTVIPISRERAQPQRAVATSLDQCRNCDLWQRATQAVCGEGSHSASIMLVGEQPGDQEDLQGKPFVGPAGQLLERVLTQSGLQRDTLYLTNAVKHFKWEPRGKRRLHKTPGQREMLACRHWLEQELAEVNPQVVVALGSTALASLLNTRDVKLTEVLGKPFQHQGRWIIAVYHPSYVLRVPDSALKEQAFLAMKEGLLAARQLVSATDMPEQADGLRI